MELTLEPIHPEHRFWNEINALATEAFPPEEYLAPKTLVEMASADSFDFWALTDCGAFVGFMVVQTHEALAYLFFLAIVPGGRSKGYGSRAISALKAAYPGMAQVVDLEMPDNTAANRVQRIRRRDFYLRNGYRETELFLSYRGVDYEVLCMGDDFDEAAFRRLMQHIQVEDFTPRYFRK